MNSICASYSKCCGLCNSTARVKSLLILMAPIICCYFDFIGSSSPQRRP